MKEYPWVWLKGVATKPLIGNGRHTKISISVDEYKMGNYSMCMSHVIKFSPPDNSTSPFSKQGGPEYKTKLQKVPFSTAGN